MPSTPESLVARFCLCPRRAFSGGVLGISAISEAKLDAFAGRDVVKSVEYVDVPDNTRRSPHGTSEKTCVQLSSWTEIQLQVKVPYRVVTALTIRCALWWWTSKAPFRSFPIWFELDILSHYTKCLDPRNNRTMVSRKGLYDQMRSSLCHLFFFFTVQPGMVATWAWSEIWVSLMQLHCQGRFSSLLCSSRLRQREIFGEVLFLVYAAFDRIKHYFIDVSI